MRRVDARDGHILLARNVQVLYTAFADGGEVTTIGSEIILAYREPDLGKKEPGAIHAISEDRVLVSTSTFPRTIAAARALNDADQSKWAALWALGDALIQECGPPGEDGVNNGSKSKIERASAALKNLGYKHWPVYLVAQGQTVRSCSFA